MSPTCKKKLQYSSPGLSPSQARPSPSRGLGLGPEESQAQARPSPPKPAQARPSQAQALAFRPSQALGITRALVVQAEQSLFRVSSDILAARSLVFKDMLAFDQPPDAQTIQGCPVVRLPDSALDVTRFFRAIFDSSFFEPYPHTTNFSDLVSILHLSNKYGVDYLRRRGLVHLSSKFPTTLAEYDSRSISSIADHEDHPGLLVATIQIAREVDALAIGEVLNCVSFCDYPAKLSSDDRVLFLRNSLHVCVQNQQFMRFLHSPKAIPGCDRGQKCTRARLYGISIAQKYVAAPSTHPLGIFCDSSLERVLARTCCDHIRHTWLNVNWYILRAVVPKPMYTIEYMLLPVVPRSAHGEEGFEKEHQWLVSHKDPAKRTG
ncbi:hypothetical protein C8R47DRAFT_11130 [Mycena vitilis]|nr:hypothetical protein C8R47DRAFT_11130 [Mycena vitilis]